MQVRDQVVEAFGKARLTINTMRIWCAADSPLPVRVERKILFGVKKLLLSWGWQGFEVHVDTDANLLSIDGHAVVRVNAFDQQLDVKFMPQWDTRLSDPALTKLISDCETSMRERKVGKGAGK